jgi:tRNA pseudouridine38-40 synthase
LPTFKITLAYDGTDYVGWQRQATGPSVQGLVEAAVREFVDHDVAVAGAGRTDAGVHALGQVASFTLDRDIDPVTLARALNAKLPPDIRVLAASAAAAGFHARFDARRKHYQYRIWNGAVVPPFDRRYLWHVPGALDRDAMVRAAETIVGTHDFSVFQATGSEARRTERTIDRSAVRCPDPGLIVYDVSGDGFLRHMVRAIVGSLVEIGRGRREPEWMRALLASRDRRQAGRTAPAEGLFLAAVDYVE